MKAQLQIVLAVLFLVRIGRADPLDAWTRRNASLPVSLSAIAYGDGQFVAVGDEGTIVSSTNGRNWIQRQSGTTAWLTGIAYGNDQFVAVGRSLSPTNSTVVTSSDAGNWTRGFSQFSDPFDMDAIAYGNGLFVAVGSFESGKPQFLNSINGSAWSLGVLPFYGSAIAYGKGLFVVIDRSGDVATSSDGTNWLQHRSGTTKSLGSITYGNGQFVAVGDYGNIVASADGTNWIPRQSGTQNWLSNIAYGSGQFVVVGASGAIMTSIDGVNWVQREAGTPTDLYGIAYGNGHFVVIGSDAAILESGSIITVALKPNRDTGFLDLSLEGPTGLNYTIQSSIDLSSWQDLTNIITVQPSSIIFDALPAMGDRLFYRAYSQ